MKMLPPAKVTVVTSEVVVRWCVVVVVVAILGQVGALTGPNVCVEKQKYNITKRVKYRAPMSVRTYEWCLAMPPRCSRWHTEVRDLTKLETEERTAEVEVCCPGYKIRNISCVSICPRGKTGHNCQSDCPPNKWGPNCVFECKPCLAPSACSPLTGNCVCLDGWQGESCEIRMTTSTTTTTQRILTTAQSTPSTTVENTTVSFSTESSSPSTKTTISTGSTMVWSTPPTIVATESIRDFAVTVTNLTTEPAKTTIVTSTSNTIPTMTSSTSAKTNTTTTVLSSTVVPDGTKASTAKESFYYKIPILPATRQSSPTIELMSTTPKVEPTTKTSTAVSTTSVTKQMTDTTKLETTRKTDATLKFSPTTLKFKPKEIWIRPATKGESSTVETRLKDNHLKHRVATKKEIIVLTTPRTIVVSIIPTSISYSLHKKTSLSSTSYHTPSQSVNMQGEQEVTESLSTRTSVQSKLYSTVSSTRRHVPTTTRKPTETTSIGTTHSMKTSLHVENSTNSMMRTNGIFNTSSLTTKPTVLTKKISNLDANATEAPKTTANTILTTAETTVLKAITTARTQIERTTKTEIFPSTVDVKPNNLTQNSSTNAVIAETNRSTTPSEETFPILTEPEHITAIATDKAQEKTSMDLISVLSIAGGVMFAVITVAVIIVMIERCRKPRYEDVRKNNMRMKVLMDEEDLPPPYVRSIFDTPLPEPPVGEKCHYQPLSTLDRNLKQFMRPVVVQTISPIMIENFRGILECHYDHLPRRSHAFNSSQCDLRCSLAPSASSVKEPLCSRANSMIDAAKCEAKLDEIDATTSEPLYAEIPAWRPPSEHAIEVMNINGEACTEL